jgi:membrane-associated phospholipid phosphatase
MTIRLALQSSAKIFSNVFSPPAVSAAMGLMASWHDQSFWPGLLRALIYGFLISLIPLALVIYLVRTGRVNDLHMSLSSRDRRIPYLVGFIGAVAACLLFALWGGSPLLTALAACNVVGLGALGLINNRWLISNHTASAMMVASFGVYIYGAGAVIWSLPLISLVWWSRWLLRKHTPAQLAAGLLVGAAPVILLAFFSWRFSLL